MFRGNLSVPKSQSRITTIRSVISQKSADLIHFAAEARNRPLRQCSFRNLRNSFHSAKTYCLGSLRPVNISPCLSGTAWRCRPLAGVWLKLLVLDLQSAEASSKTHGVNSRFYGGISCFYAWYIISKHERQRPDKYFTANSS